MSVLGINQKRKQALFPALMELVYRGRRQREKLVSMLHIRRQLRVMGEKPEQAMKMSARTGAGRWGLLAIINKVVRVEHI